MRSAWHMIVAGLLGLFGVKLDRSDFSTRRQLDLSFFVMTTGILFVGLFMSAGLNLVAFVAVTQTLALLFLWK